MLAHSFPSPLWVEGVTLSERTSTTEASFQADGCAFERAGRYEFRLYANERFLGAKAFSVIQREASDD